jgi:hypothetical protein
MVFLPDALDNIGINKPGESCLHVILIYANIRLWLAYVHFSSLLSAVLAKQTGKYAILTARQSKWLLRCWTPIATPAMGTSFWFCFPWYPRVITMFTGIFSLLHIGTSFITWLLIYPNRLLGSRCTVKFFVLMRQARRFSVSTKTTRAFGACH